MSFAGVTVFVDGMPPGSTSVTTPATYTGYHLLVVRGYTSTKDAPHGGCIRSCRFGVGGYRWYIEYYPNGYETEHAGHICFYLVLDQSNVVDPVMVEYGFSFLNGDRNLDSTSLIVD